MTKYRLLEQHIASTSRSRGRNLRLGLALLGAGALLSAMIFVAGGGWSQTPPSGAAAFQDDSVRNISSPTEVVSTPTVDWAALIWVNSAVEAAATPTPVPPTATPAPPQQPAAAVAASSAPAASNQAAPIVVAQPPASCPTAGMGGFALDLFNAINGARADSGMGALAPNACVTYVAQIRSDDMASRGYFAHVSPDGSSAFSLLDAYAIPSGWAGENLARNNYPTDQTVAVAIRDLMASPPHRENILNTHYTSMGVAVTLDSTGIYYYTMIFVGPA